MKCVIFCGGQGTRLKEETEFRPKPLVEIGGKPILWHIMKIYSHYNVKDFILTLGYKGEMIKRYFMEYHWINNDFTINLKDNKITFHKMESELDDWNVTCADTGLESGTALRLYKVKKFLEDEEDFCLTYGDGVANVNIKELIAYHKKHGKIVTITGLHPHSKYGLMVTDNNNLVTNFKEKPILNDNINGGFMVINKRIWDYITNDNEMLVNTLLPKLAELREIMVYQFKGFWYCMDTFKDYEVLNKMWKEDPKWKVWQ